MKKSAIIAEEIHFLDFTFNPNLRTLKFNGNHLQLRKKQSDVLALLCTKFPEPVSQDEFLKVVWNGGYVTSQSIAQIIRSLRVSLGDETKSIIVTIPKLGYKLNAQPYSEKNGAGVDNSSIETRPVAKREEEISPLNTPSDMLNYPFSQFSATLVSAFPASPSKMNLNKKKVVSNNLLLSMATAICLSILCIAITA